MEESEVKDARFFSVQFTCVPLYTP